VNCPFCAEEIKDEAVVCKHCRRDFSIVRPVLLELGDLSAKFSELKLEVQTLREQFAASETIPAVAAAACTEAAAAKTSGEAPSGSAVALAGRVAAAFASLLVAHYIIVWLLDLDSRWLLAATLVVPALAAATCKRTNIALPILLVCSGFLGVLSVAAMSLVAAWGNVRNALPNDRLEGINDIGWALSVALSFMTGALTRRALTGDRDARLIAAAGGLLSEDNVTKAATRVEGIKHLVEVATPVVTAIGSIATGAYSLLK
jgi:hypothetical protein